MTITHAIDEAISVRRLVGVMWTFYIIAILAYARLGPLNIVSLCCLGVTGILLIVSAIFLVRWKLRHGITTSDLTLKQAKRTWNVSLVLWLLMALMGIIPVVLFILFPLKS